MLTAVSTAPGLAGACLLYELARRPLWRERLQAEFSALEPGQVYGAGAPRLPDTVRFIKETLRLWAFPLVTHRIAYRDIDIDGLSIKRGQGYDLSAYVMHHYEEYWDDPETFDPDRWACAGRRTSGTYAPFGFGPRSCVGASIGYSQLILFCELVSSAFELELEPGTKAEMSLDGFAIPTGLIGTLRCSGPEEGQVADEVDAEEAGPPPELGAMQR